ncbi:MAG: hypothetical protein M3O70_28045 [Actinomycetota bacterium]|nr:hypothetical protein [Actinomycetota bacterium]
MGQPHAPAHIASILVRARQDRWDQGACYATRAATYITVRLQPGVPLPEMQRAARHTKADTTIAYNQSVRSFHRDPTFVLTSATAR